MNFDCSHNKLEMMEDTCSYKSWNKAGRSLDKKNGAYFGPVESYQTSNQPQHLGIYSIQITTINTHFLDPVKGTALFCVVFEINNKNY